VFGRLLSPQFSAALFELGSASAEAAAGAYEIVALDPAGTCADLTRSVLAARKSGRKVLVRLPDELSR
jgi:hypothetical protein